MNTKKQIIYEEKILKVYNDLVEKERVKKNVKMVASEQREKRLKNA